MKKDNTSYSQILKSTAIFGGSQVVVIIAGIIRTKIVALLLGTVGVGLIGIYQSVIDTFRSAFTLGLDTAGVREIAEKQEQNDESVSSKAIARYNKWFTACAISGLIVSLLASYPLSKYILDDASYTPYIAVLSACIFLAILTTGRSTILQGMRRIPEMAKSAVWGSLGGLVFTVPFYYFFGLDGIVPAFIVSALVSFLCVEYYYRRQGVKKIALPLREAYQQGLEPLRLGLFVVAAAFMGTLCMFIVRAYITRTIDMGTAGLFQSAWAITNVYLALILRSMGSDFFPRLSAIAGDKPEVRKLVNEQTYIVLIIAAPVIIGMLLFSKWIITMLYSSDFTNATTLLNWQVAGTFFKLLSWPVAFIMLAKNKGVLFFIMEGLFYLVYLVAGYFLSAHYGLDAWGISYLLAYIVYLIAVLIVGQRLSNFIWSREISVMATINTLLIGTCSYLMLSAQSPFWIGIIIFALSLLYAYVKLRKVFDISDLKAWFRKK
ncbi:O-antigen translocase [Dysgonomonas sp. 511]|uniref:O-antigen translocase n=1 Tax=Dysgonomonas sp. 511 TaxID=2302930 RepID=UPI0013D37777|nr:O-antigen translocase [Dysgonomonas sp. 511]NDV78359.1 O-antigen translocase [Dysgonomonas sp. 511]